MSDAFILVCGPLPAHIDGSVTASCSRCDAEVVVSPSGQKMIAQRGLKVLCMACFDADIPIFDEVMPPTPEQLAEIRAARS